MSSAEPSNPVDDVTTPAPAPSEDPVTPSPEPSVEPSSAAPSSAEPTTPPPPPSSAAPSSQQPTTPPPSSQQSPPSSQAPSSQQPTTPPASSSAQPTTPPPSASASASEDEPSSDAPSSVAPSSQQQSVAPTSSGAAQSSPPISGLASETTSVIDVTTTDASGRTLTTRPPVLTTTRTSTDGNGQVYTVTQVIHNPNGGLDSSSGGRNGDSATFFDNTGAVAGTFVVVGLAVTAGIMAFIFFMLRRRRRQRLDRDVAAAAAAAAAGAHHSRNNFDDDEEEKANPAQTQYGGFYAATDIHGQPQPQMGQNYYEDPTGGYDPYAATIPQPGDRSSTATAPGLAGFGAQSAQANYSQHDNNMYNDGYEHMADPHAGNQGYNAVTREGGQGGYYFDPREAGEYADETEPYQDEPPRQRYDRPASAGSITRDAAEERGLKVTNV